MILVASQKRPWLIANDLQLSGTTKAYNAALSRSIAWRVSFGRARRVIPALRADPPSLKNCGGQEAELQTVGKRLAWTAVR